MKTENTEGAIADLYKATCLKPEHAGAHELFGDALLKAGKEVEAALQWRIAEELKKKKKQLIYTKGRKREPTVIPSLTNTLFLTEKETVAHQRTNLLHYNP